MKKRLDNQKQSSMIQKKHRKAIMTDTQNTDSRKLLDRKQLAKRYSVSEKSITTWQKSGRIPFIRINQRMVRFPIAECDEAMEAMIQKPIQ